QAMSGNLLHRVIQALGIVAGQCELNMNEIAGARDKETEQPVTRPHCGPAAPGAATGRRAIPPAGRERPPSTARAGGPGPTAPTAGPAAASPAGRGTGSPGPGGTGSRRLRP